MSIIKTIFGREGISASLLARRVKIFIPGECHSKALASSAGNQFSEALDEKLKPQSFGKQPLTLEYSWKTAAPGEELVDEAGLVLFQRALEDV